MLAAGSPACAPAECGAPLSWMAILVCRQSRGSFLTMDAISEVNPGASLSRTNVFVPAVVVTTSNEPKLSAARRKRSASRAGPTVSPGHV